MDEPTGTDLAVAAEAPQATEADKPTRGVNKSDRTHDYYVEVAVPGLTEHKEFYGTFPAPPGTTKPNTLRQALLSIARKLQQDKQLTGAEVVLTRWRTRHPLMLVPQDEWWMEESHERLPLRPFLEQYGQTSA